MPLKGPEKQRLGIYINIWELTVNNFGLSKADK